MAKYVLMGRYSSQFSEGMIHTPQDRMKVVEPMLQGFGIELKAVSYTHLRAHET